jgi:3-isopropylmalate/(R)-2-methylmalate dehydratase small subunit
VRNDPDQLVRIDLENQVISIVPDGSSVQFEINPYKKECLLKGLDDIDYLLSRKDLITAFEKDKKAKSEVNEN